MKSPVPYFTDKQFAALPFTERVLIFASSELGMEEIPKGSNWGADVRKYITASGNSTPIPWCAAFLTWCIIQAGGKRDSLPTHAASTWWWIDWAHAKNRLVKTPKRGDFFVWNKNGAGHIGVIAEVFNDGRLRTIEGNSNEDGGREGYGVFEHDHRTVSGILAMKNGGFIRIEGLA